jgi:hypothetical protein
MAYSDAFTVRRGHGNCLPCRFREVQLDAGASSSLQLHFPARGRRGLLGQGVLHVLSFSIQAARTFPKFAGTGDLAS